MHRRRTEREAKAKVIASVWRAKPKCIQFLAALSTVYLTSFDLAETVEFNHFFQLDQVKIQKIAWQGTE